MHYSINMSLRPLTIHYLNLDVERLDKHVERGEFTNRSEAVRYIIKDWLDNNEASIRGMKARAILVDDPGEELEIDRFPNRASAFDDRGDDKGEPALPAVLSR